MPALLVSFHVTERVLAVTLPLSRKPQAKNTDLSPAIADIDMVKQAIQNDRTNADKSFPEIFSKVQELAGKLNVKITSGRVSIRQQHRGNWQKPRGVFSEKHVYAIYRLHIVTTEPAL